MVESLNALGRGSSQISGLFGLGLVNLTQRPQVQVLHVLAEAIKLTKDVLAGLCSSTAWMRGRIVSQRIKSSIRNTVPRSVRKPLIQDGNNMNKDKRFKWSETGLGSIELLCPACGQVVASDLRTVNAMIYRGLLHTQECTANRGHQSGSETSCQNAK